MLGVTEGAAIAGDEALEAKREGADQNVGEGALGRRARRRRRVCANQAAWALSVSAHVQSSPPTPIPPRNSSCRERLPSKAGASSA